MAWQYATYIERVAAAGKHEYSLPMYANAALIRPNYEPGQYNSGGPLPHSIDIWRAAAPSLDFLSPDIGGVTAEMIEGEAQRAARVAVGDYTATLVSTSHVPGARVSAMFLQMKPDEFLVVGAGDGQITFSSDKPGPPIVGIESIDEEFFESGAWVSRRRLNGDENGQGQVLKLSAADAHEGRIYRVRLYRYR